MQADDQIIADIVIGGGGLVGLSLGIALAKSGLEVVVVDSQDPARMRKTKFDGRVCSISYGSKLVLEGIGLWDSLNAEAEPILDIRVSDQNSSLFLHFDHREIGEHPLGWIVENRNTRKALFEVASTYSNLLYLAPLSVRSFESCAWFTELHLTDGRTVKAPLAIAADGRNSLLRQMSGIDIAGWQYSQTGIVCTIQHEKPHLGIAHERFLPAGPFAVLPINGNRSSIVWTEKTNLVKNLLTMDDEEFLAELKQRLGNFLGQVHVVGPRWTYPIELSHAQHYVSERLALVGDAAHAIHPLAGQGFNLGIRDVAILAELIVDRYRLGMDIGAIDLLSRYERWRRFDSVSLIVVTDGLNRLFSNNSEPVRLIRDVGLAAVNRTPLLKKLFMRHAMGLVGELPRLSRGESL